MSDPYYSDDHVTIYHGDCREIIDELEFDAMVTDPPYGTGNDDLPNDDLYPFDIVTGTVPTVAFGSARNMVDILRGFPTAPERVMIWAPAFRGPSQRSNNVVHSFDPIYLWHGCKTKLGESPWSDVFR